jgi:hypothetical protein
VVNAELHLPRVTPIQRLALVEHVHQMRVLLVPLGLQLAGLQTRGHQHFSGLKDDFIFIIEVTLLINYYDKNKLAKVLEIKNFHDFFKSYWNGYHFVAYKMLIPICNSFSKQTFRLANNGTFMVFPRTLQG